MINRNTILGKTLYGADIYSHIIREKFPDDVVMQIKGRDCGIIRNPFHNWEVCLKIDIIRLQPDEQLSDELAVHHDLSGTIPDGDALTFAERYYGKSGQFLLEHINKEMNLHLEDGFHYYMKLDGKPQGPRFSFFLAPITNTRPQKSVTIPEVYKYITGHNAEEHTNILRRIQNRKQARLYKSEKFNIQLFNHLQMSSL